MRQFIRVRGIHYLLAAGLWLCLQLPAIAAQNGDLAGADDPVLQAAIETWLHDDDEHSLPVFAELAGDGNIAARLLLARIEDTDRAPGGFVDKLTRKDRVALFRSNTGKGVFRPSWLKSESKAGNRTAAALARAAALEVNIEAIKALYALGEVEAAYDLIRQVAGNGNAQEKAELAGFLPANSELSPYLYALSAEYNPGLTALQMTVAGMDGVDANPDSYTTAAAEFVEWGYQNGLQSVDFDPENPYYERLAAWIGSAPAVAPIANLCARICAASEVDACAVTAFGVVGGYYKVIRFDSPLESLIEQSRYAASERAAGMLLRRIASVKDASASAPLYSIDELRAHSACLAAAVEAGSGS